MMSGMRGMGQGGRCGMMDHMMGGMDRGMMDGGLRMRMMFAIADTDGDGSLSFDEVTAIHKRIFNAVDANKDGKVTPEELRKFFHRAVIAGHIDPQRTGGCRAIRRRTFSARPRDGRATRPSEADRG
ncbi:EF-hand domain-containing protein [Methylobacterium oryzae CBMB20]